MLKKFYNRYTYIKECLKKEKYKQKRKSFICVYDLALI